MLERILGKQHSTAAARLIRQHEAMLTGSCRERLAKLSDRVEKLDKDWRDHVLEDLTFILEVSEARESLRHARANAGDKAAYLDTSTLRFVVSELFLEDCWRYLTSDPERDELLHLATGTITEDGTRVISRMEKLEIAEKSATYVRADEKDTHLKLLDLTEKHGHPLLAMFHSHISRGASSTKPSSTDIANQERFVKLGCDAIGGIFSLDGYVRFFSTCTNFELTVFGKQTTKISDEPRMKVFKLNVEA